MQEHFLTDPPFSGVLHFQSIPLGLCHRRRLSGTINDLEPLVHNRVSPIPRRAVPSTPAVTFALHRALFEINISIDK